MDQLLNIIEVIDGKYVLNTHQLQSALTLADNCDNIALISIVGPKNHGKTFLINCLINYMFSEGKDKWPHSKDAFIKTDLRQQSYSDNIIPVIKLTSRPFIIKDEIENEVIRTAVFLMDSDFVFDNEMSSQQVQDIIALFLLTSSTVIYNHKGFLPTQEFLRLKTISSRISYLDSSLESLKNIMFLIRDWSPEKRNKEFDFGLYEGSKYIENFIENIKLVKTDYNLSCCLMSAPELGTQTESIQLSILNKQFLIDLKILIEYKLFSIDEMPKKINPNTNKFINSCELFNLFENCVEKLNQNIDYNLVVDSSTTGKSEITQIFGFQSLDNYRKQLNRNIEETINPDNVSYTDLIKNNLKSRQLLVYKNKAEETEIENSFKNLVDKLLIEYNNTMVTKLEYQSLDLDKDLMETHETIKQKILEDFNKFNDIKPSLMARDYKAKYILVLNNKMIEAFKTCKIKVEVELKKAQKVLKEISYDYEMNFQSYIIDQMKDDLNTIDLNQIQIICENKAFDTFKEETVKGNIETKFSSKLYEEMNQVNDNLNTLLDSYKEYETKRQQMFPNMKYYSEEKMKKFHNNQKTIIMHKFKDSEQNEFIVSLLEKSFYIFKERNNSLKIKLHEDINQNNDNVNTLHHNYKTDSELNASKSVFMNKLNPTSESHSNHYSKLYKPQSVLKNKFTKEMKESETTRSFEYQSLPKFDKKLHQDLRKSSYNNVENRKRIITKNNHEIRESFVNKNKAYETKIENRFEYLVDELLLEYNKGMEIKLNDQTLDLDRDLKETHEIIKHKICKTFEENANDIEPSLIAREYRDKYYAELNNKMIEVIEIYKHKVEVKLSEARSQYQKVLKQISILYKSDMKSSITDYIKTDFHIEDLTQTQIIFKEKAFNTFNEETVKFLKGNIEIEFLNKLNEEINQINENFKILLDHYRTHETERQQVFSELKYYSEEKMKEFREDQKSRLIDSMQKFRDSEMIQFTVSLLETSCDFNEYKSYLAEGCQESFRLEDETIHEMKSDEDQEKICKTEKKLAELRKKAFGIYIDCFEAKLKTEFFERNAVNNIRDQLLKYTIKQMIASCDFNEDQNYFAESCEKWLKLKVQEIHEIKSNEYQKKIRITEEKLTEARKKAFEGYCHSMNAKVSTAQNKSYLKSNEFTELHYRYSKQAIESFNRSAEFLNQDYDQELANKLLIKNQSLLRQLITNKKQNLKTVNDNNTPDVHTIAIYLGKQYITAATCRDKKFEIITDKFEQEQIPNSISIGNEILIGSEAKNHYENLFPDIVSFQNFDIKQLLGRERSNVSNEELDEFPFSFLKDKLSVLVYFHDLKIDLSIESLLAFMILDIKLCAEKQIGNIMSNIVLTVPTNYTIVQKNAVRKAAKIAGFEDSDVISEISAAAINYAVAKLNFFKKFNDTILFVIINDYECDVAICSITNEKIEYKVYFHQTLNSTEVKKSHFLKKNNSKYDENTNNITKHKFKELLDTVIKKANVKSASVQIDECLIAGNSPLIPDIINWTINNKKIKPMQSMIYNSLDITKGSAFYGEMMANKINFIEISEVTTHNIYLNFDIKSSKGKLLEVMPKNTPLPIDKRIFYHLPQSSDLPLIITFRQDNQIVKTHRIDVLPNAYQRYIKHLINVELDCFGQISPIMSFLSSNDNIPGAKLESIEINPGLSVQDLIEEKQKLYSLRNKIDEEIKLNEEKLCLEQAINELRSYSLNVKNEVENNVDLRPLIKKQILSELEKTLSFLSREHSNLNEITKQKQMLDKTFEGYNYVVKKS